MKKTAKRGTKIAKGKRMGRSAPCPSFVFFVVKYFLLVRVVRG
jgi:hypothetical protein